MPAYIAHLYDGTLWCLASNNNRKMQQQVNVVELLEDAKAMHGALNHLNCRTLVLQHQAYLAYLPSIFTCPTNEPLLLCSTRQWNQHFGSLR
jgi:hypothetical protein